VHHGLREDLADAHTTRWVEVGPEFDFSHSFELHDLAARSLHFFETESVTASGYIGVVRGRFYTAPDVHAPSDLLFCVMTCQNFHRRDHRDGHAIYPSMSDWIHGSS